MKFNIKGKPEEIGGIKAVYMIKYFGVTVGDKNNCLKTLKKYINTKTTVPNH